MLEEKEGTEGREWMRVDESLVWGGGKERSMI